MAVRANTGQLLNSVSMLGQRRVRLNSIEPAMCCDAGPTLNAYTDLSVDVTVRSGVSLASIAWIVASPGDGGRKNRSAH